MLIPYNVLRAVFTFAAAKTEARAYLQGVAIESTGTEVLVTASNGHTLGLVRLPIEAPKGKYQLSGATVRSALSMARTKVEKDAPFGIYFEKAVTIKHLDNTMIAVSEPYLFPDFHRVIPKEISNEPAQYDPEYMVLFSRAGKELSGNRDGLHPVFYPNGSAAGLVGFEERDDFVGVIMPWHVSPRDKPENLVAGL